MGKGWSVFGEGYRVFTDNSYKFYFMTLILLTIYMHTERC